jgi:hypothetical protein
MNPQHPDAIRLWSDEVNSLHQWMENNLGHPELIKIIKDTLMKWQTTS